MAFKSIKILDESDMIIKQLNGTECYKMSKQHNRFYYCFIHQNEAFNKGVRWHRISNEEYQYARCIYEMRCSI